jgi:hypothetical protein
MEQYVSYLLTSENRREVMHNLLIQCSSKCGMQKDFKGYTEENELLRIVPDFYLLSGNSNIKKNEQIR